MTPIPLWPGATCDVGGQALHVRRAPNPDASPAVYVHGLGGNSSNWTDLMGLLADRVDGHAPDLPGFGRSGPHPRDRYRLDDHVAAVVAYIERYVDGAVHLFGNSLGGAVAVRLTATRPDLVRTLTLCAPALPNYAPRRDGARLVALGVPGVSRLVVAQRRRAAPERLAHDLLELCCYDVGRIHPDRVADLTAEMARRAALPWSAPALVASLRGLVRSYLDVGPRNLWAQAATIAVPTLAVFGRHDRLVPVAVAPRLQRTVPDADVRVIDGCGHIPQIELPETVAQAVRPLLGAAQPAGRAAERY